MYRHHRGPRVSAPGRIRSDSVLITLRLPSIPSLFHMGLTSLCWADRRTPARGNRGNIVNTAATVMGGRWQQVPSPNYCRSVVLVAAAAAAAAAAATIIIIIICEAFDTYIAPPAGSNLQPAMLAPCCPRVSPHLYSVKAAHQTTVSTPGSGGPPGAAQGSSHWLLHVGLNTQHVVNHWWFIAQDPEGLEDYPLVMCVSTCVIHCEHFIRPT